MARAATKTLVLGASGHLGQAILRELLRRGHKVTAATRRLRPPNLVALEVPIVTGDPDAPGQLEHWVSGHEVVIDAAAPYAVNLFSPTSAIEHEPLGYARRRTRARRASTRGRGTTTAGARSTRRRRWGAPEA